MFQRAPREQIVVPRSHCRMLLAKAAASGYGGTLPTLMRRELHRWAFEAPAAIRFQTAEGETVEVDATVTDLSAEGIGLKAQQPVPADTFAEVFVVAKRNTYSAAVRVTHSSGRPDGYHIGCAFVVRDESTPG